MDLLKLLLSFLRPGIEGDGATPDAGDAGGGEPYSQDDGSIDLDAGPQDDGDDKTQQQDDGDPKIALEAERRARASDRERADRLEREMAELRARQAPPPGADESAREEARLNDPQVSDLEKWQIKANRELKKNATFAQSALLQAQDVNDRTAFSSVCMGDPIAKKYEQRVEQELAQMRQKGQNAPREAIYTFLLGKDMRDGKFKKKAAPAPEGNKSAPRGRTPGVRSDVRGNGNLTEREKRRARLENTQI